ncbi:MAG TPA: glycosyltransferase family 2 protein [Bryobacteraceae bacterium]
MKISIAIPVFNEAVSLPLLFAGLRPVLTTLDCDYELLFVNDGSTDQSLAILEKEAAADGRVKILTFSRNFGHQAALTAAIDFCESDALVIMDADLQDPPELLPEMIRLFREGFDVVSPQRIARRGDSWFKRKTASLFYSLIRRLTEDRVPPEVGDFRLLSRAAVLAMRQLREQHRFVRGMVGWLGLKEALLPFERQPRAAGETKYSLWAMIRLSWTAITSFSAFPLRACMAAGFVASGLAILYFFYAAYVYYRHSVVPGWTSIMFLQCLFFGMTLVSIGLVGQYVARIYDESKSRPLYVLSRAINIDPNSVTVTRAVVLNANPR